MVFIFSWVYKESRKNRQERATSLSQPLKSPKRTSRTYIVHVPAYPIGTAHVPTHAAPTARPRKSAHTPLSFSISYRLFVSLSRRLGSLADSRTVALPFSHTRPRNTSRPIEPLLSSRAQSQASAQLVVLWPQRAFAASRHLARCVLAARSSFTHARTHTLTLTHLLAQHRTHSKHTHTHTHTHGRVCGLCPLWRAQRMHGPKSYASLAHELRQIWPLR